ncbi:hypothetical protein E3T26_02785 [Cryobacterium sp. TMT1-21]|uniref:hypothetical protein n=1 Tax=Cryobacterium sp. TMT1-21 TaxID=1259234 RepID=UPI00106D58D1|nr:hypothetical protein [Cryobacterium sp. TMT1-21]TFD17034.1 hypothetical protein E3T26_02785 [Cryobacterium sp. TMT1-21]
MTDNYDALDEALDFVMDCRICGGCFIREQSCICEEEIPNPDWICGYCNHEGYGDFTTHFRVCAQELVDCFADETDRPRDLVRAQALLTHPQDQLLSMLPARADGVRTRLMVDGRI